MIDVEAERVRFELVVLEGAIDGVWSIAILNGHYFYDDTKIAFSAWLAAKRDALSTGTKDAVAD